MILYNEYILVWFVLGIAILAGAAFTSWLATVLAMRIALRPFFRSLATDWTELAPLSWNGRRVGAACLILVPAPVVVDALATMSETAGSSRYLAAVMLGGAAWLGVMGARVGFARRIVPAFAMTPRATRNWWIARLISLGLGLGIPLGGLVLGSSGVVPAGLAYGLGVALLIAGDSWGRRDAFELLGVLLPGSARLSSVAASVAERMGVRLAGVQELALPMASALAYPRLGRVVCTSALLEILNDEELAAVLAHELAHLSEPRKARWARLARAFARSCVIMTPAAILVSIRSEGGWALILALVVVLSSFIVLRWSLTMPRWMALRAAELAKSFEPAPGSYARALEKMYQMNRVPPILIMKERTHPDLPDRLIAAGARKVDFRPNSPPGCSDRLGLALALFLVVTAGFGIGALGRVMRSSSAGTLATASLQEPGWGPEVQVAPYRDDDDERSRRSD